MKLQIDTTNKTVKVEGTVPLTELIETIKKLLPNDWKKYSLQSDMITFYWNQPDTWHSYQPSPILPYTTCGDNSITTRTTQSIYNLEVIN